MTDSQRDGRAPAPGRRSGRRRMALVAAALVSSMLACSPESRESSADPAKERAAMTTEGGAPSFGGPLPASASLREILEHPDALVRLERLAAFLRAASPDDLPEIRDEFEVAQLERGDLEYALFANWWARLDPKSAFAFADHSLRMERPRVLLEIVRVWARMDPAGLLESEFLNDMYSRMPAVRPELSEAFVVGWFESGAEEELVAWIMRLGASSAQSGALSTYMRMRVLRDGPEASIDWAFEAPFEEDIRRILVAAAMSVIAHEDPQLVIATRDRAEALGIDVSSYMPRIANGWSHHDPAAAMAWVTTFPDDQERARAVQRIVTRWLRRDADGVFAWLAEHEGKSWTDPPRYLSVRRHVRESDYRVDWPEVMDLAAKTVDYKRRVGLQTWLLQRWLVADEAGAEAWLAVNAEELGETTVERARQVSSDLREEIREALERAAAGVPKFARG